MRNWLQRIVAILLLSTGLACIVVPFPNYLTVSQEIVIASANPIGLVEKPDPLWIPDAKAVTHFPEQVLAALDDDTFVGTKTLPEPGENVASFFPPDSFEFAKNSFFLLYEERLFEVRNQVAYLFRFAEKYGSHPPSDLPEIIHITALGKIYPRDSGVTITDQILAEQPGFRSLFPGNTSDQVLPYTKWKQFAGDRQDRAIHDGRLFEIEPVERLVDTQEAIPWLRTGRLTLGGGAILVGLILLIALYLQKPDMDQAIQIGTPRQQIAGDAVVVAIGTIAVIPWIDAFLHRTFGAEAIADEEFGRAMGAFYLAVAVPCVALYLSMIGSQWFTINDEFIRLRSLLSDRSIPWDELETVECVKSQIGSVKSGAPMVRTLQRSLVFLSKHRQRVAVMEPAERIKIEILTQLEDHAPEKWKPSLEIVRGEWLGYESW